MSFHLIMLIWGRYHPRAIVLWGRISHRFGPRAPEWAMTLHMFIYGVILLRTDGLFDRPVYGAFQQLFWDQTILGVFLLVVGVARIVGLVVNGFRERVTPQIRQASAGLGCMVCIGLLYCFWQSGYAGLWAAAYPTFIMIEISNVHRAARDQGGVQYVGTAR